MASFCDGAKELYGFIEAGGIIWQARNQRVRSTSQVILYDKRVPPCVRIFLGAQYPLVGQGFRIIEASRSYSDTPY